MKKLTVLLVIFLSAFSSFATEIRFEKSLSWKQIKEKAAKENKMIFFDAYASWCGPCKYLESDVYTDEDVAAYYNSNYINVKFDMENGEGVNLSEEFGISSYPTLMFFTPQGKLVHKYVGAMEPADFLILGIDARDPSKQYFTLKENARNKQLTDAAFLAWVEMADKIEDDDKDEIVNVFLQSKKDLVSNAELAKIALLYAGDLQDQQIRFLYKNQSRIIALPGWTEEKVKNALYNIVFSRAWRSYERNNDNLDSFKIQFRRFDPQKERYAVKDMQFRKAVSADPAQATQLIIGYLNEKANPLSLEDIAGWILDYSSYFEEENFRSINTALQKFTFRPMDKNKEYWSYLVQLLCEVKLGNMAAAKVMGEKAYKHPSLPEAYKEVLENSYGFGK